MGEEVRREGQRARGVRVGRQGEGEEDGGRGGGRLGREGQESEEHVGRYSRYENVGENDSRNSRNDGDTKVRMIFSTSSFLFVRGTWIGLDQMCVSVTISVSD